jgi:hypothetical protein
LSKADAYFETAEQLRCHDGLSYEEIADRVPVSTVTLCRWGKKGNWDKKREKYLKSRDTQIARLIKIRDNILDKLDGGEGGTADINPNTVHQLLAGYRQASAIIDAKRTGTAMIDRPAVFLDDLRFIVEELAKIDPAGVAAIDKYFDDLIEAFKEAHAQE